MIKQVVEVDEYGFYIQPVWVQEFDVLPANLISIPIPESYFKAKWQDGNWIEGATIEEIEEIKNSPKEHNLIDILLEENTLLKAQIQAASERSDFHEELIAEMAMMIYS